MEQTNEIEVPAVCGAVAWVSKYSLASLRILAVLRVMLDQLLLAGKRDVALLDRELPVEFLLQLVELGPRSCPLPLAAKSSPESIRSSASFIRSTASTLR